MNERVIEHWVKYLAWVLGVMWVLLSFWVLFGCAVCYEMRFQERAVFSWDKIDSVLNVHGLPALEAWRGTRFYTMDRKQLVQYTHVAAMGGKGSDECIYTIETRDSIFLFVKRIKVKCKD